MSRAFQWYVACHLHASKSGRFLTFNLTPNPSFGHNLCFKYPNGSWDPILDIYVPKYFQWNKKLFNPMSFDPCNFPRKIWKSIWIPIPKTWVHLGVWGSFPHTLLNSRKHEMWLMGFNLSPHLCKPLHWSWAQR